MFAEPTISDGAGDFEDAVIGSGAEVEFGHRHSRGSSTGRSRAVLEVPGQFHEEGGAVLLARCKADFAFEIAFGQQPGAVRSQAAS